MSAPTIGSLLSPELSAALGNALKFYFPLDLVLCSGGVKNILYAFGVGYGLSMFSNGGLVLMEFTNSKGKFKSTNLLSDIFSPSTCGPYYATSVLTSLHGLRTFAFLLRRQRADSYKEKFNSIQERSDGMKLAPKCFISTLVSLIMGLYTVPLQLGLTQTLSTSVASSSVSTSSPLTSIASFFCLALSTAGLALETVSDEQKLSAKSKDPKKPVMTGLFKHVRHANYFGEIMFHAGIAGMGVMAANPSSTSSNSLVSKATALCLATLAPGFMIYVMFGAAKRLDKEGLEKYADNSEYKKWRETTWSVVPGMM